MSISVPDVDNPGRPLPVNTSSPLLMLVQALYGLTLHKLQHKLSQLFPTQKSVLYNILKSLKRRCFQIIVVFSCRNHSGKVTIIPLKQSTFFLLHYSLFQTMTEITDSSWRQVPVYPGILDLSTWQWTR